ncbi:MAG: hypothetical protein JXR87_00065 [Candidatus Marinimicrobia bacterium]|nr:hypothetical protein [Candidatus Neomarinimicrobiota bacterium]
MLADVVFVIWIYITLLFILAIIKKDYSIIDIGWGIGFILITIFMILQRPLPGMRELPIFL